MKRIVIIGFQSAGLTAAGAARLLDRDAKITAIERRMYATCHPCGLPFLVEGKITDIDQLIEVESKIPGIEVKSKTEAKSIDRKNKQVEIQDVRSGGSEKIPYDKLIIGTGSVALKPRIPGVDLKNVFTIQSCEDAANILSMVGAGAKNAVVIGAGLIGIEVACALRARGIAVTVVEILPNALPGLLDPDMAEVITEHLKRSGVDVFCSTPAREIIGKTKVEAVLAGEKKIPADFVVLAVGFKPNVELAAAAGLKLGPTGLVEVDEQLRTSDPDIYAAGDCAESKCLITKRPVKSQLATTAIRMGRVAGINAAGGKELFQGVLNTATTSAEGLEVSSTGLTASRAKEAGLDAFAARVRASSRPRYFPGTAPITVKLIVEKGSGRVLGGQIIGEGAAERADLLAFAIAKGSKVEELARMEYCYAPPVSDEIEPLVVAAQAALRRL
ncbi:MAG: FAD-dependent oxidoreductase [Candidatus Hadarchaeota archaeon]